MSIILTLAQCSVNYNDTFFSFGVCDLHPTENKKDAVPLMGWVLKLKHLICYNILLEIQNLNLWILQFFFFLLYVNNIWNSEYYFPFLTVPVETFKALSNCTTKYMFVHTSYELVQQAHKICIIFKKNPKHLGIWTSTYKFITGHGGSYFVLSEPFIVSWGELHEISENFAEKVVKNR